jgi:hypothetical protein
MIGGGAELALYLVGREEDFSTHLRSGAEIELDVTLRDHSFNFHGIHKNGERLPFEWRPEMRWMA